MSRPGFLAAMLLVTLVHPGSPKVIDLSHKLMNTTFHFQLFPGYSQTVDVSGSSVMSEEFMEAGHFTTSEHTGTHIDAPRHFAEGAKTVGDIPIEMTIADGVKINCRAEAAKNREFSVTVKTLTDWEKKNGRIPDGAAVILDFGKWPHYVSDFKEYSGTDTIDDVWSMRFPYVSVEAARWMVDQRDVRILASDTLSPDPFQVNGVKVASGVHTTFLASDRLIVENLKIPDELPTTGFRFYVPPPGFQGASGTPVRAFAVLHPDTDTGNGAPARTGGAAAMLVGVAVVAAILLDRLGL